MQQSHVNNNSLKQLKGFVLRAETLNNNMMDIGSTCLNIPINNINEYLDKEEDWYLTAEQAKSIGLSTTITKSTFIPKSVYNVLGN